jgi:hypothetical protein
MNIEIKYLDEHDIVRISWHGLFSGPRDAPSMMNQARPVLEGHACTRILFDFGEAQIVDSTLRTYETGSRAKDLGYDQKFKAAILYSQDEKKHAFVETVMRNRRYNIRIFQDESTAISWLTDKGDS